MANEEVAISRTGLILTWKTVVGGAVFVLGLYVQDIVKPITGDIQRLKEDNISLSEKVRSLEVKITSLQRDLDRLNRTVKSTGD